MKKLVRNLRALRENVRALRQRRDDGASAVEYGLLVALIALVIGGALFALGQTLSSKYNDVENCVSSASCATPAP